MAKQVTHFKCLVISPSDVDQARDAVRDAITDWNAHSGEGLSVKVEAVRWESHTRPELGAPPQSIINRQIVDDCDFGIAVFWTRLGTPTSTHESGSIEEIERLLARGANVLVYFCDAPVPQERLEDDQFTRLQEVKKSFRERGLLASYSTIADFRRVLPLHLNATLTSMLIQQRADGQPIPSQGTVTAPTPDVRVELSGAFIGRGASVVSAISVAVQNHSPSDFYFAGVEFPRGDGMQIVFQRSFVTEEPLTSRKIEPGNAFSFFIDPVALKRQLDGHEASLVVVRDRIGRRFNSRPGDLAAVLKSALEFVGK